VELLFFDHVEDARPSRVIVLEPGAHRTYHYWHAFVRLPKQVLAYAFPASAARSNRRAGCGSILPKVLLDPYGRAVAGSQQRRP